MQILLITGASGFVGQHAVRLGLANPEYDIVIASDVRDLSYSVNPGKKIFCFFKLDLTNPKSFQDLRNIFFKLWGYGLTVWHIGGCFNYSASYDLLYRVNVLGTRNLMVMLCGLGVGYIRRFIFWSGGVLYGNFDHPDGKLPADENYPVNPQNDYGWSKKEAEDWIMFFHRKEGLPVTIMRLAAIYGPKSQYGIANAIFLNAWGSLAPLLVGDPQNRAALIHCEDVIGVADFLGTAPESNGEIYNVVDQIQHTMHEISIFIGSRLHNRPFSKFYLPNWVLKKLIVLVKRHTQLTGGRALIDPELGNMTLLNSWMSNQKLMDLAKKHGIEKTLFKYPDAYLGLDQTIGWYKKEGLL